MLEKQDALADMGRCEGYDGTSFHKSVNGWMGWNAIQNSGQNPALQMLEARLGAFNQADAAPALGQHAVAVVLKLRFAKSIPQFFQFREPFKFGAAERKPIGQATQGFDDGKVPAFGGRNGKHALRFGQPVGDADFFPVFGARKLEARILDEKSNDIEMTGARAADECLHIPGSQRTNPAPGAAERSNGSRSRVVHNLSACKKAASEDVDYGRSWHGWRRAGHSNESDSA